MKKPDINDYNFDLPKRLIAQTPARPRDHAKLLIYDRANKSINDDHFYNLCDYLPANTTLVLNDSKVEKARMRFGNVEIFVIETINPTTIKALVFPGRKFKLGELSLGDFKFHVVDIDEEGIRTIQLDRKIEHKSYDKYRLTPLPPYIQQNEKLSDEYQTVYAKPLGSKAAPTAGLHFTEKLLAKIRSNHKVVKITLHVGLGTFAPLKRSNILNKKLHAEEYIVSDQSADELNKAKHITAVGTTTTRVLESLERPFHPTASSTDIFITPGHKFDNVNSLITNFHLPKTSLLMLVSAFIGSAGEMKRIYEHAIANDYRFYSFGDAMLIL